MNLEEIYKLAETEYKDLKDSGRIKIYVSSLMDDLKAPGVFDRFQTEIDKKNISANVIRTGSFGYYDLEPVVMIEKPGHSITFHDNVTPETAFELMADYLIKDNPRTDRTLSHTPNLPLFDLQNRIALRNCGYIDPENIAHYILLGQGYRGLSKALKMSREEVIAELKKSGLRGRGGAGFNTADKWQICRDAEGSEKYLICNAVDADPQSKTARLLLESDPHSVLEGMLIGAYVVGAVQCIICVNAENRSAVKRLRKAIDEMKDYSLTGNTILDSSFHCEIEISEVEAALVMGEETALLRFMEAKQAMSYVRPPYPAVKGFSDKPTLINNIETFSNVSAVLQRGSKWFAGFGTERSKGTKVITFSGAVLPKFTIEVEFGTRLLSIIDKIGSGASNGKKFKAVQLGGPTGAYFNGDSLDIPIDYEAIEDAGSIIGSGTIEVLLDDVCAVETCRDLISYIQTQSCGKCVFCREGSRQISDILTDITHQMGKPEDLDLLIELSEAMKIGCICALGRTTPNPVLSSIRLFRDE
jgi:NADH-quinone oxidoreductase subunit F